MSTITLKRVTRHGQDVISTEIETVVIAGWAARDEAAVRHHIDELAALGVPPPSSVPVFYRVAAQTLTQSSRLCALGGDSSGEVEPVIVALADGLWVGIGSDHTDRKAEVHGIALSKQMCGKVVGTTFWPLMEVADHWDQMILSSRITIGGQTSLYQEGLLAKLRTPQDLIAKWAGAGGNLPPGTLMFGGTLGAIGGIRPADRFDMSLEDPVLGRSLSHGYDIDILPVVA